MSRTKIDLPSTFSFSCQVPVRITDLNYGGHVGNDTVLSLVHEARMQFLGSFGYSEMNFEGPGMIMANVAIEFKSELFYGDIVTIWVAATAFTRAGFELVYKLEKETAGKKKHVAFAKTGMICFDYEKKKIVSVPDSAREKLSA